MRQGKKIRSLSFEFGQLRESNVFWFIKNAIHFVAFLSAHTKNYILPLIHQLNLQNLW